MFQHPGAIYRQLMLQRCTSQPADLFFVLIYKPALGVKIYKMYKIYKTDIFNNLVF